MTLTDSIKEVKTKYRNVDSTQEDVEVDTFLNKKTVDDAQMQNANSDAVAACSQDKTK